MRIAVIIAAGGSGTRYARGSGFDRSKLDEDLGGRPVLHRAVEVFDKLDAVCAIIVAGPGEPEAFARFRERHADRLSIMGAKLVMGGALRSDSVAAALREVPSDATHVAVHDGARPCTPPDLVERLFAAAEDFPAVIPALDVVETLKRVSDAALPAKEDPLAAILGAAPAGPGARLVERTIDRAGLVAVQTPQVFAADLLRRAYAQSGASGTDDAELVERLGEPVAVIEGDARNIKITRQADLGLARAILGVSLPSQRPVHKRF
jgi:2-C-methyl-D-erythritol 4-phosphate cytidylyltransferase